MQAWNTAILLFDGVEVLDFAGPFEVFSRARLEPGVASRRTDTDAPFRVFTVAKEAREVSATGGLRVVPQHGFQDAPPIDLLVVPGGFGTLEEVSEILVERQLGVHAKPLVLLNYDGFWDGLLRQIDRMVESRLVKPAYRDLLTVVSDAAGALDALASAAAQPSQATVDLGKLDGRG